MVSAMNVGGLYFEPLNEKLSKALTLTLNELKVLSALKELIATAYALALKLSSFVNNPIERISNSGAPREVIHKVMLWHKIGLIVGIASVAIATYLLR